MTEKDKLCPNCNLPLSKHTHTICTDCNDKFEGCNPDETKCGTCKKMVKGQLKDTENQKSHTSTLSENFKRNVIK